MNILVVSPFDLLHIKAGGASRIWSDIAALKRRHNVRVLMPSSDDADTSNDGVSILTYRNIQNCSFLSSKNRLLFDMHSQVFNASFIRRYRKEAKWADVIIANFPTSFLACKHWSLRGKPIIYIAHVYEYGLVEQISANRLIRGYVRSIESYACKYADRVACASEDDKKALTDAYRVGDKITLVPNGVASVSGSDDFSDKGRKATRLELGLNDEDFIVIYHANFGVIANQDALDFITEKLVPALRGKGVHMLVVGASISPKHKNSPEISFFSDVPDIWPYLRSADAEVVPIRIGSGTRLKILESFYAGLPVISTPKGIEGIPYEDHVNALISPLDEQSFVDRICELKADIALRERLSSNARELFIREFSTDAIERRFASLLEDI